MKRARILYNRWPHRESRAIGGHALPGTLRRAECSVWSELAVAMVIALRRTEITGLHAAEIDDQFL